MRLSQAIKGFLIARSAEGYSENTLNIFRNHLGRQLIEFLGDVEVDAVTPQDPQGFMGWLREGVMDPSNWTVSWGSTTGRDAGLPLELDLRDGQRGAGQGIACSEVSQELTP